METKKLPIGKSDFKNIIEGNYCYVDKTLFIKEVIDKGDSILLIPRPRRFGKTLNLSMLKYFYDCCPAKGAEGTGNFFFVSFVVKIFLVAAAGRDGFSGAMIFTLILFL